MAENADHFSGEEVKAVPLICLANGRFREDMGLRATGARLGLVLVAAPVLGASERRNAGGTLSPRSGVAPGGR
jgi:hypothetical protein